MLTPGIRPDEQREIEGRGGFSVPRGMPPTPTEEEIQRDFPVAFRCYELSSKRVALTRTRYVGQDYSQRWGNFFAHSLVVADLPHSAWPIDYYEWAGWRGRLEPEEDTEDPPAPLSPVDLDAIEPSPSFAFNELSVFLGEAPGRTQLLASMIRAVFFGGPKSRALVVRDTPLNGVFWLACVQKAFPAQCAASLSVSTYQYDSRGCGALNATTLGTDFLFDDTQRRFQFCMFDLAEGRCTEIPDDGAEYASAIATWMAGRPAVLESFQAFMAHVDYARIDDELVKPLRLFRLMAGEVESLPSEQLVDAVAFAARHVEASRRAPLVPLVSRAAETAAAAGRSTELAALLGFLAESASSFAPSDCTRIAALWISCFDRLREGRRVDALPVLWKVRRSLAAASPEIEREIAARLLTEPQARAVGAWLSALPQDALEGVLREILAAATTLRQEPPWASPLVRGIIADTCARARNERPSAVALLRALGHDPEALAYACRALVDRAAQCADEHEIERRGVVAGGALVLAMAGAPDAVRAATRRALDTPDGWPVLMGEWCARVEPKRDLAALYHRYSTELALETPAFDREHRDAVASIVAKAVNRRDWVTLATEWLTSGEIDRFGKDLQAWCVTWAAASISLDSGAAESAALAHRVAVVAHAAGVVLAPDLPILRALVDRVGAPEATLSMLPMKDAARSLRQLSLPQYKAFLRSFLAPALRLAKTAHEHGSVLKAVFVSVHASSFNEAYLRILRPEKTAPPSRQLVQAALLYWMKSASREAWPDSPAGLREPAVNALTELLVTMERSEWDELIAELNTACRTSTAAGDAWSAVLVAVSDRRRSLIGRLVGLFKGPRT